MTDEELDGEIGQADFYKERIYATLIAIEKVNRSTTAPAPTAAATPPSGPHPLQLPLTAIRSGYLNSQLSLLMAS